MHSKLLALFALVTVAIAQEGFPGGQFCLRSGTDESLGVVIAGDDITEPGATVALSRGSQAQLWTWDPNRGLLANADSNDPTVFLTAPQESDVIVPGEALKQQSLAPEAEGINQIWTYFEDHTVRSLKDLDMCMTAQGMEVVMKKCDETPEQGWLV